MITYGYTVKEGSDPFVDPADKVLDEFAQATTPGAFLVDVLPFLRHVPSWFPGARFQRLAALWREDLFRMIKTPLKFVRRQTQDGTAVTSFVSHLLGDENLTSEKEDHIKWTAAAVYGGGADTVSISAFN